MTDNVRSAGSHGPSSPDPGSGRKRARNLGANLLVLGLTMIASLALFELGVRLLAPQTLFQYRFSPVTWYEPRPGGSFVFSREEFEQRVTYNDQGLRDRERSRTKPKGVTRILVVGDSFTEGQEVGFEETMAQRLETALDRTGPTAVEVLNLGVAGYTPVQVLKRLEQIGFGFQPDHVLFLASQTDYPDNLHPRSLRLHRFDGDELVPVDVEPGDGKRAAYRLKDFLKSHSMGFQWARYRLQQLRSTRGPEATADPVLDPTRAGGDPPARVPDPSSERIMRGVLRRMRDQCRANGASFTATMATTKEVGHPDSWVPAFARLCEEEEIPFVDLRPHFGSLTREGVSTFYLIDGHWNATGHQAASEVIADYFREWGS